MKILVVSPYIPYPPSFGGSVRIYHLLRELSRSHDVTVVTYCSDDGLGDPAGLEDVSSRVVLVNRPPVNKRRDQVRSLLSRHSYQYRTHHGAAMQEAIERTVREKEPDLIVAEFVQMAVFDFSPIIPLVIDEHNVEYDLMKRMAEKDTVSLRKLFNMLEAAKLRREELACLRKAALVLATSERDAEMIKKAAPGLQTSVITNGVDVPFFAAKEPGPEPDTAVFVGATHYFPNEDGLCFFMENIYSRILQERRDFRLEIVGGRPPPRVAAYAGENVHVTGFVEDVRPYMWSARVFVVPLRMGGGTRLKVVEAMAAGIPVVSTTLGAEGIPAEHDRHLLLADDPAAFAQAVIRVLKDREKAEALRRAGREFVGCYFDWPVIGKRLDAELGKLVGQ